MNVSYRIVCKSYSDSNSAPVDVEPNNVDVVNTDFDVLSQLLLEASETFKMWTNVEKFSLNAIVEDCVTNNAEFLLFEVDSDGKKDVVGCCRLALADPEYWGEFFNLKHNSFSILINFLIIEILISLSYKMKAISKKKIKKMTMCTCIFIDWLSKESFKVAI